MKAEDSLFKQLQKIPRPAGKRLLAIIERLQNNMAVILEEGATMRLEKRGGFRLAPHPALKPVAADMNEFNRLCRKYKLPGLSAELPLRRRPH